MINFLFLSPHYPQRLFFFAQRLRARGINVFGMGDTNWHWLNGELREALTDYQDASLSCYGPDGVFDGEAYNRVLDCARAISDRNGGAHWIESFNEWWLPLEAQLRNDLGVSSGPGPFDTARMNRKSLMKQAFRSAGVAVAEGELLSSEKRLLQLLDQHGALAVKPDWGVGASDTRKISSPEQARKFMAEKNPSTAYFVESFIGGDDRELVSFDGLAGPGGEPVFYTVHRYSDGIMEITEGQPLSYYSYLPQEIPPALKSAGLAAVKAFGLKNRFFHIEFFRRGPTFYGLEINARPPGVLTLDMMNHAKGIDVWDLYARLVCGEENAKAEPLHEMVTAYAARLSDRRYAISHDELLLRRRDNIFFHMPMDSKVMGDYAYVLGAPDRKTMLEIIGEINHTE